MGEGLILPESYGSDAIGEEHEEAEEPQEVVVSEDWELMATIIEGQAEEFPDDTPEMKELRLEMALTRHVNQQKVMSYSRMNEVNPMTFLDPTTLQQMYIDLILDWICPEMEDRLRFEVSFEHAVQAHVDAMGMQVARARAQALDPTAQQQLAQMNRQQRRAKQREMAKVLGQK